MSAGSPKFTVRRVAALSLVSLWLAGCTSSNNAPAPVSSVNGETSSSTNSGMLITPPQKMGSPSQPQIQPVPQHAIPRTNQSTNAKTVVEQPVETANGRRGKNRQEGKKPKGS